MWFDIFVQVIGFIAIGMNLVAVQFNKHWKIVTFNTLGSFLFGIQYLFLGAYTGVVMEAVGWIRNIVFIRQVKLKKPTKKLIYLFSVITLISGIISIILSWDKSILAVKRWSSDLTIATALAVGISIISIIAKILSTVAYGIENPHNIRMLKLPVSGLWFFYNIIAFSIAGVVNEVMSICSILIAEWRFKNKKSDCTKQTDLKNQNEKDDYITNHPLE